MQHQNIYVVDTSSLIKLKDYPHDVFTDLWNSIESILRQRRIIAPIQVYNEIRRKRDEISDLLNRHRNSIFIDPYKKWDIMKEACRIMERYPNLIISSKKKRTSADPYVIALAIVLTRNSITLTDVNQYIVVTEDTRDRKDKKSIRSVCIAEGIRCITLIELFREEGWKFTRV